MAAAAGLEELQLTAEEAERLTGAFRDERFRALLAEYAAELADPEQRRLYEAEVVALERERGVQARFVHPAPGYVLRTSQAGARRCYVNVCSNPLLGRPEARAEPGGQRWSLPYSLAPGREELGRAGRRRLIYDVVFHPEALRLAGRSARFRRLLSDTALEAVQGRFGLELDRANAAALRGTAYKGVPHRRPRPVPRELVLTVELPLLGSAGQAALEVRGRELRLDSRRPDYRLRLRLPYAVDESRGRAAFHKASRQLVVTLPPCPSSSAKHAWSPGALLRTRKWIA
uniref:Protein kintoun n=1 Tax=Pelusios castaneus TaxID=367368 RepID=A0A8C8SIY3_9SAUR